MRYNYNMEEEKKVVCNYGAEILVKGIRDPTCFTPTVLVCPIHQDKIIIPCGLPKRKWEFVKVISEGKETIPYSSYWVRLREKKKTPYIEGAKRTTLPTKNKSEIEIYKNGSQL